MLLTPQVQDLLTDGFDHIISEEEFPRWNPLMGMYFHEKSSTKPDENVSEIAGFGLMQVKTEGAAVTYDDIMQAFDTTYTHVEYALATEISEITLEDDQYDKVRNAPRELFASFDETVETIAANHLNRGFTAGYTGGNGQVLFSASHPLMGGGTLSNTPSAQADFDAVSYEQALIDISNWTDHRGKKLRFRPSKLIVPTEVVWDAEKLFGSAQDPDSANNAINPAARRRLQVIENPFMTSTKQWVIQCDRHYMTWYWRRRIRSGRDNDFQTGNFRWKIDFRASSGWDIPLGMFSSSGSGT